MLKRKIIAQLLHPQTKRLVFANRRLSTTEPQKDLSKDIQYEEVTIPVPWGHISCVRWGPQDKQPIVAFHGWQDNAFTWKRLIPHLSPDVAILAVDFPGHGKSSWFPPGMFYKFLDNAFMVKRIAKYFDWKSMPLLGHSMGAITSFKYATLFPEEAKFLILIDNLKPMTGPIKNPIDKAAKAAEDLLRIDERNISGAEPPSYTMEEMVEKLYLGGHKSVDKDKCHILLERAIAKSSKNPDKYYFTRDSRLKHSTDHRHTLDEVKLMARRLKCPILHYKFESWTYFEPKEHYDAIVDILKESNKDFEMHVVSGTHHGHLNNPEVLLPHLNNFIQKYY